MAQTALDLKRKHCHLASPIELYLPAWYTTRRKRITIVYQMPL